MFSLIFCSFFFRKKNLTIQKLQKKNFKLQTYYKTQQNNTRLDSKPDIFLSSSHSLERYDKHWGVLEVSLFFYLSSFIFIKKSND